MNQIYKFYLASSLKNFTFYVPILVVFFQSLGLDYQQIFWIFTLGSIVGFILELPSGIFADFFGKKISLYISKFLIFVSFLVYGFAFDFLTLLIAHLIFEIGNAFRTGTEAAYVYDYTSQNQDKNIPTYTKIKGEQKFYARFTESFATAVGGFIAAYLGYSWVFFLAAIPAFLNFILLFFWEDIQEEKQQSFDYKKTLKHIKTTSKQVFCNLKLFKIIFNITVFSSVVVALDKFIQPYMQKVGIELEYFGLIYSAALLVAAIALKYASNIENKFGTSKAVNILSFIAPIPIFIIGLNEPFILGVGMFFLLIVIENFRSPIINNAFHENVESSQRATTGSVMSLFKNGGKLIILPFAGYFADAFSIFTSITILGIILLISSIVFFITKHPEWNPYCKY